MVSGQRLPRRATGEGGENTLGGVERPWLGFRPASSGVTVVPGSARGTERFGTVSVGGTLSWMTGRSITEVFERVVIGMMIENGTRMAQSCNYEMSWSNKYKI